MQRTLLAALASSLLAAACAAVPPATTSPTAPAADAVLPRAPSGAAPPRLVLLVVVDQLRHDTLERFAPLLSGGLARLRRESVSWSEARHGHAETSTAPGHATLATGTDPARHGIVGNDWYERAEEDDVYCVDDEASPPLESDGTPGDEDDGRSPHRMRADGLGDWLRARRPAARVWGLGGKDRGAILLAGRRPSGAVWFDRETGRFVTSAYYLEREPAWMAAWHRAHPLEALLGTTWEPLAVAPERLAAAGVVQAEDGRFARRFPYPLGAVSAAPDEDFYEAVYDSPFVDERLARFARALVEAEGLGADETPDLLALSFSAFDAVGHAFGPDSFEAADTLLRLDRALGELFAFLDARVGEAGWGLALSSDHGVAPLPELQRERGVAGARRAAAGDVACLQRAAREAGAAAGLPSALAWGWSLAPEIAGDPRLRAVVSADLARRLAACGAVDAVFTAEQITRGEAPPEIARSFFAGRSGDVAVRFDEHFVERLDRGTTHGTSWEYDRRVPWLLRWPGIAPRSLAEPVETVDVAPTVAALLGLPAPAAVDGRDRSAGLR
jgi:hypothetical protein